MRSYAILVTDVVVSKPVLIAMSDFGRKWSHYSDSLLCIGVSRSTLAVQVNPPVFGLLLDNARLADSARYRLISVVKSWRRSA